MKLGAGRRTKEDAIDHAVGIVLNKKDGDKVQMGDVLAYVHTNTPLEQAWIDDFYATYSICQEPVEKQPLIYKIVS